MSISKIFARQIFDSRGNPTIEVDLYTAKGMFRAACPSGASTGTNEACELRDKGKDYHGKGVSKAIANVNDILGPAVIKSGFLVTDQAKIDALLNDIDKKKQEEGAPKGIKTAMGANAILSISMAVCKAGAAEKGVPLYRYIGDLAGNKNLRMPVPAFNVINGGSHAGNKLAMQEFMILPTGAKDFTEAMQIGSEVYHHLKAVIKKKFGQDATNVGDEGGFAPNIIENEDALKLIMDAIAKTSYGDKIQIAMDTAASEFFVKETKEYDLDFKTPNNDKKLRKSPQQLCDLYSDWVKRYPIVSIEDGLAEDDWESWTAFKARGLPIQIVGDDLTVTNPTFIQKAIELKACDCLLLKVNQIGSVSESIEAWKLATSNGWGVMVSHRSGETEDTFIADLVVGLNTGQIKTGAPCRSERLAKYNALLRIEEDMRSKGPISFAGKDFRGPSK